MAVSKQIYTGTVYNLVPVSYTHLDVYKRQALRQQFRPCCPVDGTIHTAATQQTPIGRIHDAVTVQFGNCLLYTSRCV